MKIPERKIIMKLTSIFNVDEESLPKTLQRFKDEVQKMEKQIKKI